MPFSPDHSEPVRPAAAGLRIHDAAAVGREARAVVEALLLREAFAHVATGGVAHVDRAMPASDQVV